MAVASVLLGSAPAMAQQITGVPGAPDATMTIDAFIAAGGDRAIPVIIFGVKPEYLNVSFDEMQKRYGTIEHYFSAGLGIDASGQKALRDLYLEKN